MLSEFQKINFVDSYAFPRKSCLNLSESVVTKVKKLTVSQELLNEIISVRSCSLKEISKEINICAATLRRIKSGTTKKPSLLIFKKILGLYCHVCQ